MAYTNNIPTAPQRFKDSQPLIQANFLDIDTALAVNHVGFNLPDVGKHKFLQMPVQGAAPVTAATEMGLYTKTGVTTNPEMFIRRESNGTEIEFTARGNTGTNYYSMLPSGLLIKFGSHAPVFGASPIAGTITYDTTIPFSAVFSVVMAPVNQPSALITVSPNFFTAITQTFTIIYSGSPANPITVSYFSVGIP